VELRERLALPEPRQVELLASLSPHEGMVVSTCNRVELYLAAPSPEQASQAVRQALSALAGPQAREHLYEHRGEAALVHLFRVAASLDSMVVGEPQILGQMKDAFERAQRAGHARGELARACAAAFGSAKRVRTETEIGRAAVSMASAAVNLASKIFGGLHGKAVLLVGAGEMAELAGRPLASAGASRIVIANRTLSRAEDLAQAIGGTARPFDALLPSILEQKVTNTEAWRGYRGLLRQLGERAPGPMPLLLPATPTRVAALPYYRFHPLGIERRRAELVRRAAREAPMLEAASRDEAYRRMRAISGIGPWTVAEVGRVTWGDPDAVSVGDFHLPSLVAWAFAGERTADDERMLHLLEPYRGQRGRVQRLLELSGLRPPRHGPRLAPRRFEEL
jgi:hypothetical protein